MEEGDLEGFHDRALSALAGTGSYLIAVDNAFRQLLNTRVGYGTPLGQTSDPETAEIAMDRGVATISPLFFGQTAQTYVFNVWLPVSNVEPVRLVTMTQNARNLVPALQSRQLPDGWKRSAGGTPIMPSSPRPQHPIWRWDQSCLFAVTSRACRTEAGHKKRWGDQRVVTAEWRSGYTGWRIIAWASAAQVQKTLAGFDPSAWVLGRNDRDAGLGCCRIDCPAYRRVCAGTAA